MSFPRVGQGKPPYDGKRWASPSTLRFLGSCFGPHALSLLRSDMCDVAVVAWKRGQRGVPKQGITRRTLEELAGRMEESMLTKSKST